MDEKFLHKGENVGNFRHKVLTQLRFLNAGLSCTLCEMLIALPFQFILSYASYQCNRLWIAIVNMTEKGTILMFGQ